MSHKEKLSDNNLQYGDMWENILPAYLSTDIRRSILNVNVKRLPEPVQNRIIAAKNIQFEYMQLLVEFYKEVYELEVKYHTKYQPLMQKANETISGIVKPTDGIPKWKIPDIEEKDDYIESENEAGDNRLVVAIKKIRHVPKNRKSLPFFWFTIFNKIDLLSKMVQNHDLPVLTALHDIQIRYFNDNSYMFEFYFKKNDYFTNSVLTKRYWLQFAIDRKYPFGFDGPEIFKCEGCDIIWKRRMNLILRYRRKKQGENKLYSTFFEFFNPPELTNDNGPAKDNYELNKDFMISNFLRVQVIPHAILYYTGDIVCDELYELDQEA